MTTAPNGVRRILDRAVDVSEVTYLAGCFTAAAVSGVLLFIARQLRRA